MKNTWIDSHVIILGSTIIGSNNKFFSFSKYGLNFQESTNKINNINLIIGNNNVNIGSYSFIGSNSIVYFDILPYMSILFNSCSLNCFNLIGLKKNM